jgi:hypothetical protein
MKGANYTYDETTPIANNASSTQMCSQLANTMKLKRKALIHIPNLKF